MNQKNLTQALEITGPATLADADGPLPAFEPIIRTTGYSKRDYKLYDILNALQMRDWLFERGIQLDPNLNGKRWASPCWTAEREWRNEDGYFEGDGDKGFLSTDGKYHKYEELPPYPETGGPRVLYEDNELEILALAVIALHEEEK